MDRVSCLMVTQKGREALAGAAIRDFYAQTWPGRELVIVSDYLVKPIVSDQVARWYIAVNRFNSEMSPLPQSALPPHGDSGMRPGYPDYQHVFIHAGDKPTLGQLRNIALDHATGDYCIQWDDDDRYHPERISVQMAPLVADRTVQASCLTGQLYYFKSERELYWIDWHLRRPQYNSIKIPGTICFRRLSAVERQVRYPETGEHATKGEDGKFLEAFLASGVPVAEIPVNEAWVYVRQYHGSNTWSYSRFQSNALWMGLTLEQMHESARKQKLRCVVRQLKLADGPIDVMARDKAIRAYTIEVPGTDSPVCQGQESPA